MRMWVAALATIASIMAAGEAAAAQVCSATTHTRFGETRAYFRDVLGACRPDGYCSVVVALRDDGGAQYRQQLRVARPTPGAPYSVEFVAVSPSPQGDATPMSIAVGGQTIPLNGKIAQAGAVNEYAVSDAAVSETLVTFLRKSREARWTYQSNAGPSVAPFPLRGMTAALNWIDCVGAQRK